MFEDWPEQFTPPLRRAVDPPQPVLIDLGQAIPTQAPNGFGRNKVAMRIKAGGLNLTGTVPGLLRGWARATDGSWLGLCEFTIETGNGHGRLPVAQLVPRQALAPAENTGRTATPRARRR
ncbi:hypothetical protein [Nocardia wallacei]|uniref:hypothetical protein n=1 Tax=Nocardia wallacei TaxID=480035 RepID=UPI0024580A1C|nr:hypothetical protein [Nocardia wallacei]